MKWFLFIIFTNCPHPQQQSPGGNPLDKLVSSFQAVYNSQLDEDAIFSKCKNAISFVEKVDKDAQGDFRLGKIMMFTFLCISAYLLACVKFSSLFYWVLKLQICLNLIVENASNWITSVSHIS